MFKYLYLTIFFSLKIITQSIYLDLQKNDSSILFKDGNPCYKVNFRVSRRIA